MCSGENINNMVNLGDQSSGGGDGIGHSQRNGADPDVIDSDKFPAMFLKLPSFLSSL